MRKIEAIFGIAALAAVAFFPRTVTALTIHVGPYYFHVPFVVHHHRRHHPHGGGSYNTATRGAPKNDQTNQETRSETNTGALESCTGLAAGVTNLPIDQIRRTVHPTADQEAVLDDLSAASSQASDVVESSCAITVALTPVSRLDAAEHRLDASINAVQIVRPPLVRFYEALSDEQRRQFNALKSSAARASSPGNMATFCSQQAGSFIDVPVQRLEQVLQPTAQQQAALENLRKVTQHAAEQLQSSCPTPVPRSPMARLDTIETRLNAMANAIKSVRPALENFYASLDDEQKARFNLMGPPPRASSSQPQP